MGITKIEWTATIRQDGSVVPGYTYNPWRGCSRVSAGCVNCYAERQSRRNPAVLGEWGTGQRVIAGESYWRQPLRWNQAAKQEGTRQRVFCGSMMDVCEILPHGHPSEMAVEESRLRLMDLIDETPHLDWLLLTKRPQNGLFLFSRWWDRGWPDNVWAGVTVENRRHGIPRINALRTIPARIRFLSIEPLLEDLGDLDLHGIHWVIVGGESGPGARPMHPDWARPIRDQCQAAGVPFLFKQWGNWSPDSYQHSRNYRTFDIKDRSGNTITLVNTGKKEAGRELDGRTWDEVPKSPAILTFSEQRTEQLYA